MRRFLSTLAAVGLIAGPSLAVPAAPAAAPPAASAAAGGAVETPSAPDFDVRTASFAARQALVEPEAPALRAAKAPGVGAALASLERAAEGLEVRWSATTGGVRALVPVRGALAAPRAGAPAEIALDFVREHRALYGLEEAEIAALRLAREYATGDTGVTHLTFLQEAAGRRVYGADLRVAVDASGRVVWAGGELVPNAAAASKRGGWALGAAEAAAAAAETIGAAATPRVLAAKGGADEETVVDLGEAFVEPATARQVLFPIAPGAVRPAWTLVLAERGPGNVYVVTVDAEKGTLLARHNLTRYLGDPKRAKFRVFTKDSPQPNIPRSVTAPAPVDRQLVALTSSILDASPEGWVDGDPRTIGNNVRAQEDRDANNSGGLVAAGDDDYVYDPYLDFPIKTEAENTEAAIVNLFYWINFTHDYLYRLGFDEAAGNFQSRNFSGEGIGTDQVLGDAQDGAGSNNANFATYPDGRSPRMQMFLWRGGYDGSFDQTVIIHEYVHGLSTRLVGGPDYVSGLTGPQSGGMGEGWSDWYALTMLAGPEADPDGDYVVGHYVTQGFVPPRSTGVRNFAYTTDIGRNPLTYGDIDPATADVFNNPTEVHNVGEVWCSALWEVRAAFVEAYGFDEGKALVERLVTDGMKFTVNNPSFVDARDGILVADQVRTGGANQCLIWRGFAKRGVGFGAYTLNGSATAVRESFDLPPWCEGEGRPSLDRASYSEEETALVVRVGDGDLVGQPSAEVTLRASSGDGETVALARADRIPGLFEATVPLRHAAPAAGNGALEVATGDTVTVVYADASAGGAERTAEARVVRQVRLFRDRLEKGRKKWKAGGFKLTTEASASPSHSWTDSPGGNYADETVYRLELKKAFDLTGGTGTRLVFKHKFDTEPGYDLCIVEASLDGTAWTPVGVFSGLQRSFTGATLDLSAFDGASGLRIRFSLVSDRFVNEDGWHIDDVQLETGRP